MTDHGEARRFARVVYSPGFQVPVFGHSRAEDRTPLNPDRHLVSDVEKENDMPLKEKIFYTIVLVGTVILGIAKIFMP